MKKTFINDYSEGDRLYSTREQAEKRLNKILESNRDVESKKISEGRGPFKTEAKYEIIGDEYHGYFVREFITKEV